MPWEIRLSSTAEKYYQKLPLTIRRRAKKELEELGSYSNPLEHPNVKPLTGDLRGFYRLRIGDYRIVFAIIRETKVVAVVNFAPRGDAYK